jgi:hypothetical protein
MGIRFKKWCWVGFVGIWVQRGTILGPRGQRSWTTLMWVIRFVCWLFGRLLV